MATKIIITVMIILSAFTQDILSIDDNARFLNILKPILNKVMMFDGPTKVTHSKTTPTTNKLPNLKQMKYYNLYSASMYCQYELNDLSCKYCKRFKKHVCEWKVFMNNVTDLTSLVTLSKVRKEIVVAFRGSQNIMNVFEDIFSINYSYDDDIKLHYGFYLSTMSVYLKVTSYVAQLLKKHPKYKIVVTGHSLGAAMARVLTFIWLKVNEFSCTPLELYTFGEPRVGNIGFANFFNRQNITSARIVNKADILPHLPPVSFFGTNLLYEYYVHPQLEFTNGKFCDSSYYEDPKCSYSNEGSYNIIDHLHYLDLNYAVCFFQQPIDLLALPVIFQPVGLIPPLPPPISEGIGLLVGGT